MRKVSGGFTLIELMVVVVVISIIAAISIPNLMRSRMSANEASAVGSVRTLSSAEFQFQSQAVVTDASGMGMFGDLAQLNATVPQFVDDTLGSGTKNGYTYAVDLSAQVPGFPAFAATAIPINPNFGSRAFYVDQRGVITFTNDGSIPNANSDPVQ